MAGRKRKIEAGRLSHSAITTRTIKDELRELGAYGDRYYQVDGQEHRRESLINNSLIDARHIFEDRADTDRYNPMANARDLPFVENNAYRLMRLCKQWVSEEEQRFKAWQDRYRYHLSTEIRADRRRVRIARNLSPEDLPSDPDEPIPSAEEEDEDEVEDDQDDTVVVPANAAPQPQPQNQAEAMMATFHEHAEEIAGLVAPLVADIPMHVVQAQPQPLTVEQMLQANDQGALFNKLQNDFVINQQIRIRWSNDPDLPLQEHPVHNAVVSSWNSSMSRNGTFKYWVNIRYDDGSRETIGRSRARPFTDFWKRLVQE